MELPPGLPAKLPKLPEGNGTLTKPSNPAPEASNQGKKRPLDADNEVVELDHKEATGPPKKKKKKKNKSKDKSKDETPALEAQDDGAHGNNSAAEPEVVTKEPVPSLLPPELRWRGPRFRRRKRRRVQNSRGSD